jgi:hypothetical protein
MRHTLITIGLAAGLLAPPSLPATGVYQEPDAFIAETFEGRPPAPKALWVTPPLRAQIERILGHGPPSLRIRYWAAGGRTAWILEEVGKEEPITTGIVVRGEKIEKLRILIFRESRGWEVRHGFFTEQFPGAGLDGEARLDRNIDGVSGATLSVRAVTKLARLALYLDAQVDDGGA